MRCASDRASPPDPGTNPTLDSIRHVPVVSSFESVGARAPHRRRARSLIWSGLQSLAWACSLQSDLSSSAANILTDITAGLQEIRSAVHRVIARPARASTMLTRPGAQEWCTHLEASRNDNAALVDASGTLLGRNDEQANAEANSSVAGNARAPKDADVDVRDAAGWRRP